MEDLRNPASEGTENKKYGCISYAEAGNPKRVRRMIPDWKGDVNS
jgi:hypothetical protein